MIPETAFLPVSLDGPDEVGFDPVKIPMVSLSHRVADPKIIAAVNEKYVEMLNYQEPKETPVL